MNTFIKDLIVNHYKEDSNRYIFAYLPDRNKSKFFWFRIHKLNLFDVVMYIPGKMEIATYGVIIEQDNINSKIRLFQDINSAFDFAEMYKDLV